MVTNTEFDAHGSAFSTVGLEINIENRHKDPGALSGFGFKGTTAGVLLGNFPSAVGQRDWSFGVVFYPLPHDGNFSSTDPNNWNGFHDGVFVDFYKRAGVRFGRSKAGAYGLLFPASYAATALRPSAAMHLGDNVLQMGQYLGVAFSDGDLWANGGLLFYRRNGRNMEMLGAHNATASTANAATNKIQVRVGSNTYFLLASTSAA